MKRLLAAGCENLFQLGPCFRDGEHGRWHHPEFTLLEWYRANAGYLEILADTKALLAALALELRGTTDFTWQGKPLSFAQELWEKRTVSQAFIEHAGWDPALHFDPDRFDLDLVTRVEPALPADRPVVLMDYPAPPRRPRPEKARRPRPRRTLGALSRRRRNRQRLLRAHRPRRTARPLRGSQRPP